MGRLGVLLGVLEGLAEVVSVSVRADGPAARTRRREGLTAEPTVPQVWRATLGGLSAPRGTGPALPASQRLATRDAVGLVLSHETGR